MPVTDDLVVERQCQGDIGIVRADGVVDLATMRPMREAVRGLIADGVRYIVLDLRDVGYMDSAGISIIMTAKRGVAERDGDVYVSTRPGEVERALSLIQIDRVVHLVPSPEAVIEQLGAQAPA